MIQLLNGMPKCIIFVMEFTPRNWWFGWSVGCQTCIIFLMLFTPRNPWFSCSMGCQKSHAILIRRPIKTCFFCSQKPSDQSHGTSHGTAKAMTRAQNMLFSRKKRQKPCNIYFFPRNIGTDLRKPRVFTIKKSADPSEHVPGTKEQSSVGQREP